MSYEEEFDRIIRQKAEQADYPFDQANWERAANMLKKERYAAAGARMRRLFLPVAAVAVLGTGAYLVFDPLGDSPAASSEIAVRIEEPVLDRTDVKENYVAPAEEIKSTTTPAKEAVNGNEAAPVAADADVVTATQPAEPTTAKAKPEVKVEAPVTMAPKTQPEQKSVPITTTDNKSAPVNEENIVVAETVETTVTQEDFMFLSSLSRQLDWTSDADIMNLSVSMPAVYDDYFNKKFHRRWFGLEAGLTYNPAWMSLANGDGSYSWYGGLTAGSYLNRKLALSSGLQVFRISGLSQQFHEMKGKDYSFGSTPSSTVISTNQLCYAAVPVRLHYAACRNSMIVMEVNAGYLYDATNKAETHEIKNDLPVTGQYESNGVFEGMNRINVQVGLGVDVVITRRLSAHAGYLIGINDLYDRMDQPQRSQAVRVGLHFTICEK